MRTSSSPPSNAVLAVDRRLFPHYVLPVGVAVVAVLLLLRFGPWVERRPGGDDGGRIRAALVELAGRSVPASAKVTEHRERAPYWDSCGGREGTGGWQPVQVAIVLDVDDQAAMDDARRRAGWTQDPNPPHWWYATLKTGQQARLMPVPDEREPSRVTLVFTAQPPGPKPTGC